MSIIIGLISLFPGNRSTEEPLEPELTDILSSFKEVPSLSDALFLDIPLLAIPD